MRHIKVMHGPERRRRWTDEERLRILAEAVVDAGGVEVPISEPSPAIVMELGNMMRMTSVASAPKALVTATLKALR